jgi:hypothetical protein
MLLLVCLVDFEGIRILKAVVARFFSGMNMLDARKYVFGQEIENIFAMLYFYVAILLGAG